MYSNYASEIAAVLNKMDKDPFNLAITMIVDALKKEVPIHIFGNGGSSATASHFVVDWKKSVGKMMGVSSPVYCLTDNTPLLTAFANDISFDRIFAEMLLISAKSGDIALAITGSGNSQNVIEGVKIAQKLGCTTIALTGFDGGIVGKIASLNCNVPSDKIQIVEDVHSTFGHAVVNSVLIQ